MLGSLDFDILFVFMLSPFCSATVDVCYRARLASLCSCEVYAGYTFVRSDTVGGLTFDGHPKWKNIPIILGRSPWDESDNSV